MKRHINFWLVMFLAISLALPIYSMAQTTKLTLESPSGDRIGCANVKTFSFVKAFSEGADNNLVVYLDGAFNCVALLPDILLSSSTNCTITGPASVTASPSATLSFTLVSTTGTFSPIVVDPDPGNTTFTPGTGVFTWNTGGNPAIPPGSYLAVFEATSGANTSQLVVMIKIALQYKLTLTAGENGDVSPAGVTYYDPATPVQISATASQGYYFNAWNGHAQGNTNPLTVTMSSDKTITATFTQTPPTTYTLTTSVSPAGGGTVSGGGTYNEGATATVTVLTTTAGYTFSNWSGAASGTSTTTTVLMNGAKSVTANFTPPPTTPPSGALGTKTNPYKINKPAGGLNVYIPENSSSTGAITIPAGAKWYFVVDPGATIGKFKTTAKFYGGAGVVCSFTQDKGTGVYSDEVCVGGESYNKVFTILSNKKFLFAIDNIGVTAGANDEMWVIIPFVP